MSTPSLTAAQRLRRRALLWSRLLAAILGGYALAALASVAALSLPLDPVQAVLTGQLLSFLLYAGAVVWVFAVRSAWHAWRGLLIASALLLLAALPVWLQGTGA